VALPVAVSISCAPSGEDEDGDPLLMFISSESTRACVGLLFELGLDCCWAARVGLCWATVACPGKHPSLSFSFLFFYLLFLILFEFRFEFIF
jgi:hypothetical protein